MKKLIVLFMCFAMVGFSRASSAANEWLPNFEDVPQMEKTYVVADTGFVYSVAMGKILQTTLASDDVSRRQFQRFYKDALYELGWKNIKNDKDMQTFERGNEILNIEILTTDPLSAQFTLTPKE